MEWIVPLVLIALWVLAIWAMVRRLTGRSRSVTRKP